MKPYTLRRKEHIYICIYTAKKMSIVRKVNIGNEMYIKGKRTIVSIHINMIVH